MKFQIFLCVAFVVVSSAVSVSAQVKPPKFASVYTNLAMGCKSWPGSNGSDGYSICKGPGGYQVRIYYSAATTQMNAELKGTDHNFPGITAAIGFEWDKLKLEWRLANGKPFALIMRQPRYAEPADGEYFGKVIGQQLAVIGLLSFEDLDTKIDTKTAGANALAREVADSAYLAKH